MLAFFSFLTESSIKLLVTRKCVKEKSLKGVDFGHIRTADIGITWS